jgi:hypothetical protein
MEARVSGAEPTSNGDDAGSLNSTKTSKTKSRTLGRESRHSIEDTAKHRAIKLLTYAHGSGDQPNPLDRLEGICRPDS